jgi:hypothetical protein
VTLIRGFNSRDHSFCNGMGVSAATGIAPGDTRVTRDFCRKGRIRKGVQNLA